MPYGRTCADHPAEGGLDIFQISIRGPVTALEGMQAGTRHFEIDISGLKEIVISAVQVLHRLPRRAGCALDIPCDGTNFDLLLTIEMRAVRLEHHPSRVVGTVGDCPDVGTDRAGNPRFSMRNTACPPSIPCTDRSLSRSDQKDLRCKYYRASGMSICRLCLSYITGFSLLLHLFVTGACYTRSPRRGWEVLCSSNPEIPRGCRVRMLMVRGQVSQRQLGS